jgi:hypothetical protein
MNNEQQSGLVTGPNLISYIEELSLQDYNDLTDCTHIATKSADLAYNRFTNAQYWLEEYIRTLMFLGWSLYDGVISTRTRYDISGSIADFLVQRAHSINDSRQANAMTDTLDALKSDKPAVLCLDEESRKGDRFQVVPARYDSKGNLNISVFNLELVAVVKKSNLLFWNWESRSAKLIGTSAFLKLNRNELNTKRALMEKKLHENIMKRFALRKNKP